MEVTIEDSAYYTAALSSLLFDISKTDVINRAGECFVLGDSPSHFCEDRKAIQKFENHLYTEGIIKFGSQNLTN